MQRRQRIVVDLAVWPLRGGNGACQRRESGHHRHQPGASDATAPLPRELAAHRILGGLRRRSRNRPRAWHGGRLQRHIRPTQEAGRVETVLVAGAKAAPLLRTQNV